MHLKRKDSMVFLSPALFLYSVFVLIPILMGLFYSFTNINGLSKNIDFVGFNNFIRVFGDEGFWYRLKNTLLFTLAFAVMINFVALVIALLLELKFNRIYKGVMRILFYLPAVLTPLIVGYMWYYILKMGFAELFSAIGLETLAKIDLIGNKTNAMIAIIIVTAWMQIGPTMIIFVAGLSNISPDYYEAAEIDGANKFQVFMRISIPLIIPSFMINFVLSVINGFKQFDQIYSLTGGGPGNATETLSLLIYFKAYSAGDLPYACATAFIQFVVVMLTALLIIRYFKRREE